MKEDLLHYLVAYNYKVDEQGSAWGFGSLQIKCRIPLRPEDIEEIEKDVSERNGYHSVIVMSFTKFE